jgi:hypothetical protein
MEWEHESLHVCMSGGSNRSDSTGEDDGEGSRLHSGHRKHQPGQGLEYLTPSGFSRCHTPISSDHSKVTSRGEKLQKGSCWHPHPQANPPCTPPLFLSCCLSLSSPPPTHTDMVLTLKFCACTVTPHPFLLSYVLLSMVSVTHGQPESENTIRRC